MQMLVTGASGFTGGHLARALKGRGYQVRALVRNPVKGEALSREGIEPIIGDLVNAADVRRAVQGCLRATDPFRPVTDAFADYQGPDDGLSPCLYSDYRSVSSFYFSRLFLARSFGLETLLPFYDRDLVEFGARIPAHLKLEGVERTKRLFRVAMEGVLPDIINHRKDKLGHSVPSRTGCASAARSTSRLPRRSPARHSSAGDCLVTRRSHACSMSTALAATITRIGSGPYSCWSTGSADTSIRRR